MRRSIRVRLLLGVMALVLPLSAVAGWLLIQVFGNRLLHDLDVTLEEEAETVAELLNTPVSEQSVDDLLAHIAGETDVGPKKYIVVTRGDHIVAAAPADAPQVLAGPNPALRIVRHVARGSAEPVTVSIGVSAAAAVHARQRLTSLLAVGLPVLVAVLGTSLWVVIGRALWPLETASRHLDAIAADSLSVRVPVDNPYDEVGRMVMVLNRMLDRLQRAVAQLQRFTADAAHELRTPLAILRTGMEVALARERSAEEYRVALEEALVGTNRLRVLAEDLLTLARLEAAAGPGAAVPVDIGEMLHELADAATGTAAQRQLTVGVTAETALWVTGNAGDLYRLFNNLIDNALRYSANGEVSGSHIELSARRTATGIETTICDDGAGIPPDDLPRVFDRFYRGNGERGGTAGSGLGLSIAQEIARTHGGRISVANRVEKGCVVSVWLPERQP